MTVGYIVGRFQTHQLTRGHLHLFHEAYKHCERLTIIVGVAPFNFDDVNPLTFEMVKQSLLVYFEPEDILKIEDINHDEKWSNKLDSIIQLDKEKDDTAVLICSRDSFKSYYKGIHFVVEIDELKDISATNLRKKVASNIINSTDFRKGVIHASLNRFPTSFQAIDICVVKYITEQEEPRKIIGVEILLGRKEHEDLFRFPGGFVDPLDESLEDAARRELREETQVVPETIRYAGSYRINDWRYRRSQHKIMTAFFIADYCFGSWGPQDDLAELAWVNFEQAKKLILDGHKPLLDKAEEFINKLIKK